MKLDLCQEFGPVLRLRDFDHEDLTRFRDSLLDLSLGARSVLPLHELSFVEPQQGCRLTLKAGDTDEGLRRTVDPNLFGWVHEPGAWQPYDCVLSRSTWARLAANVEMLLHLRFLAGVYVWLHRQWHSQNDVHWLLSADGEW